MIMICKHYLWLITFGSFSNQVDGLHQQIVVEVLVNFEQKAHAYLSQSKGKNQSGDVKHEVFVILGFFFNFHIVKGQKVRGLCYLIGMHCAGKYNS